VTTTVFHRWREALLTVAPVAALGTLMCCALPITFVAIGAGSVMASLVASAPWLVILTQHKAWAFGFSGVLLVGNFWILYRSTSAACQAGGVCHISHPFGRWTRRLYWGSVGLYLVGLAAAYLSLPVARMLGY
jgi:hypothetical protein